MNPGNQNRWLLNSLIAYMVLSFLTPVVMYQLRDNNRLIVIDGSNSFHVSEYASKEQLTRLYEYTARQATDALFMRNPNGLDRPDVFQDMYSGPARAKALNLLKKDVRQFGSRDIHQKVEVLHIKVMEADSRKSFVKIEGQLLRSSQIDGQRDSSVVRFEIAMSMNVNYDLGKNALYPFLVTDFTYQEQK